MNMNSNSWNVHQLFGLFDQNKDGVIDAQDIAAVSTLLNKVN
jgi:Ca2+-binding EF-hand superfamily protein